MNIRLSALEARILGALIEKEIATPDQYPLSLNALVAACNQKTNRDPVLELDERTVQEALDALSKRHLVLDRSGFGSRVVKWRHRLCNGDHNPLQFSPQETAVVCELLLRGPQTPGELRQRAQRLAPFQDLAQVEATLERLMTREEGPFVVRLERQPGARESRYAQLFTELPADARRAGEHPPAAAHAAVGGAGGAGAHGAAGTQPAGTATRHDAPAHGVSPQYAPISPEVQALLDKQAIHEVLAKYCRALDRCDVELMKSVYWEDAVDAHGIFHGNAHEFCEFIVRSVQDWFEVATHVITNLLIDLRGDVAYTEAYLYSYCRVTGTREKVEAVFGPEYAAKQTYDPANPVTHDFVMGGRYVDKLQKRNGEWRILRRTVVHDWNQNGPSTAIWKGGIYGQLQLLGRRDREDEAYRRD
jgi:uncharacterized protein YceH (UPF0502 family)/ketosteroid isomerase-like protein